MLIIPEIETVVILPPRTGSGSLYRAVLAAYPKAFMPYRHMEADGVPFGYDRWRRIGVLRHPLARLWSLYNYLKTFGEDDEDRGHFDNYYRSRRESVNRPFAEWLVENEMPFSSQFDDLGVVRPQYTVNHPMPETRKSQFVYLRPDLGVEIVPYTPDASEIGKALGIEVPAIANVTGAGRWIPPISAEGQRHLDMFHSWDLAACAQRSVPFT
mgnify:CR=1 FL=1